MSLIFEEQLTPEECQIMAHLSSPARIQSFLDETPYSSDDFTRSSLRVLRDRQAHCLDGALFAASAMRRLGYPPLLVDMLPEPGRDDDHVLVIYKLDKCYGAVAKSNYVGLRYREPIYRNLRELVMSFFEDFFNILGEKTLRAYTRPFNLAVYDHWEWEVKQEGAARIEKRLYSLRPISLLNQTKIDQLSMVDALSFQAGCLGVNEAGLFKPDKA